MCDCVPGTRVTPSGQYEEDSTDPTCLLYDPEFIFKQESSPKHQQVNTNWCQIVYCITYIHYTVLLTGQAATECLNVSNSETESSI